MIVDCALYEDGRRQDGDRSLVELSQACRGPERFVWIGLYEPTAEEFDAVAREFAFHELAVEDALSAHQRPKLDVYEDSVFVVLKTARYIDAEEAVELGEIQMFVGRDFIVHVRHGEASPMTDVRRRLDLRPDLLKLGPAAVAHAIVDRVVDDYAPVLAGIEKDISEVELEVFAEHEGENPVERIYKLKREVLEMYQGAVPLDEPLEQLAGHRFAFVPDDLTEYFRDVHDHLLRIIERITNARDLLTGALDANLTRVSIRQNEDMRRISAWAAIAAVPTMVAGIYGMNFRHMPELGWQYGYLLVVSGIAAFCGYLYWRFRKTGWL